MNKATLLIIRARAIVAMLTEQFGKQGQTVNSELIEAALYDVLHKLEVAENKLKSINPG